MFVIRDKYQLPISAFIYPTRIACFSALLRWEQSSSSCQFIAWNIYFHVPGTSHSLLSDNENLFYTIKDDWTVAKSRHVFDSRLLREIRCGRIATFVALSLKGFTQRFLSMVSHRFASKRDHGHPFRFLQGFSYFLFCIATDRWDANKNCHYGCTQFISCVS